MTTKQGNSQSQYITTSWTFLGALFLMLENVKSFSTNAYKNSFDSISQQSARLIRSCSFGYSPPRLDTTKLKMGLTRVSSRGQGWGFPSMENLSGFSNLNASLSTQMRVFGSWHQEVDFRAAPPVYDDREIIGDYTTTEFLPALSDWVVEEYLNPPNTQTSTATSKRFRPFRMVRRVANWAFGVGLNEVEKTSF